MPSRPSQGVWNRGGVELGLLYRTEERLVRVSPANRGFLIARSAGLEPATFSARSHSPSQTGRDSGGQGETNQRFYQQLSTSKGTGRGRERHPVAVRLRSVRLTRQMCRRLNDRRNY